MTCIVGVVHKGKVWLGGDSAGVDGDSLSSVPRVDKKIFRNGPFIMGFTTSFRMGQLLTYAFDPPRPHGDEDLMRFMVTDFVDAVRHCLMKGGFAERKDEVETGGTFLVGYDGRLFNIAGDYQVGENSHGFDACGCGEELALGSLFTTKSQSDPKARLKTALMAAGEFSGGVRPPYYVIAESAEIVPLDSYRSR